MRTLLSISPTLDRVAISTSALCAIHCLCLPILLVMFPAVGATFFGQESFHVLLLWLVIPLSLVALTMGCRKHKNRVVAVMGLIGITFMVVAATLGHDLLGETGERLATLAGAVFIGLGHFRNFTLCRRIDCDD